MYRAKTCTIYEPVDVKRAVSDKPKWIKYMA